ncbi:MAG: membrane protein insertion efficiency factor YidD [SAR202 cluster bacterium]|nr:membrane protein insertion efficiency factor YidD [SAR202 cluster bacterium]
MKRLGLVLIRGYQRLLSPILGSRCRYYPTCSDYAYEAVDRHGLFKGTLLAARRLGRCNPVGGEGYDPVPETNSIAE